VAKSGQPVPEALPAGADTGHLQERIDVVRRRRTGNTVAAVVLVVATALFVYGAATNPTYSWPDFARYLFDWRVIEAARNTLLLTVFSMLGAVVLGVLLAVMRLSPNRVLQSSSWVYLWIFRGTPVYVQLVFWGLFSTIYKEIHLGIPFGPTFAAFSTENLLSVFQLAVLGLALNEAAYMAEIVRAGISSVDPGQAESATALGLTWWQTMSRIVLPQAMRVIIPPTGNEVISMLKTTSLVTAVPYSLELYTRTRDIASETFNPIPMLLVASAWYLMFTSVLMAGQFYLERSFADGSTRTRPSRRARALSRAAQKEHA
jgi:polar amino acid transport system permease protein